jgi:hypothetical protein
MAETDVHRAIALFNVYDQRPDSQLFAAFRRAAVNPAGADAFRIAAMRAVAGFVEPDIEVTIPAPGSSNRGCGTTIRFGLVSRAPSTLPSNARQLAMETIASVVQSATSASLKQAATCWQEFLDLRTPVDLGKISVTYVCGNRFRIANANRRAVELNFRLSGSNGYAGEFGVTPSNDYVLTVDTVGTLSVYEVSKFIGSAPNGGMPCR